MNRYGTDIISGLKSLFHSKKCRQVFRFCLYSQNRLLMREVVV